jgi:hypothetical protein
LNEGDLVVDETLIHTDDLTENGVIIIKIGYDRWLKKSELATTFLAFFWRIPIKWMA